MSSTLFARLRIPAPGTLLLALFCTGTLSGSARAEPDETTTIFQQLKAFGKQSSGGHVSGGLLQGTDGRLYGTAAEGGSNYAGTIFRLNPDGSGFTVLRNLEYSGSGGYPHAGLIEGSDGKLYGTTSTGGSGGAGTVFRLNRDGSAFSVLHNFGFYADGGYVESGLVQGSDGALYGTTSSGGAFWAGTIYRVNTDGSGFAVLLDFDYSTTGGYPHAGLVRGADGALYGTSSDGGAGYAGTLFSLNPDGSGFQVLRALDYVADGGYPRAGLTPCSDGSLRGACTSGGLGGYGTLFRIDADGSDFAVLADLDYFTTGGSVDSELIQGADGAMYGVAPEGGSQSYGTLFRVSADGSTFGVLCEFDYGTMGAAPRGGLIQAADGSLCGTSYYGGQNSDGTLYSVSTDGSAFRVLADLSINADTSETGGYLYSGLLVGADGALYGTSYLGGRAGYGTLFRMNRDGSQFAVLQDFDYSTNGGYLQGGLAQTCDGTLFGVASMGGSQGYGTLFRINPDGSGFGVLREFDYFQTGGFPDSRLLRGADGALYGTAASGGPGGYGTVFKINPDGSGFSVLKSFDRWTTGGQLFAGLIQGSGEALYGTTYFGGAHDAGVVFRLNTDGSGFAILASFDPATTGAFPQAGLLRGSDGALYGTTTGGGAASGGTIFRMNSSGSGFTVLKHFDWSTTGAASAASLVQGTDNALYGTASSGGSFGYGTVFRLKTDGSSFNVLQNFDNQSNGGNPAAELVRAPSGQLFGTTSGGGEGGAGTVFRLITSKARPTKESLWPPNHGLVQVGILGTGGPEGETTVQITGVTQDEPTNGLGDGDTPIDAVIQADGTVLLRAERAGTGDGRVYHIHFTVAGPEGSYPDLVTVKVPKLKNLAVVESGELYDSTN